MPLGGFVYKKINDYELLYMVGERNNFDILYQKYQPLIVKEVKKYQRLFKTYGYELEDLIQIGYLTLYKTSCFYNEGNLFYTYFKNALKKAIISEIRINETYKKRCLNEACSYDEYLPNTDIKYLDILSNEKKEDYDLFCEFTIFKNTLSFTSTCVLDLLFNGYKIEEIECLLDANKETIHKSLNEIREQYLLQSIK